METGDFIGIFSIPKKYYAKEGLLSVMGLGYTAALATVGFSLVGLIQNVQNVVTDGSKFELGTAMAFVGGCVATWGYLITSQVEY